MNEEKKVEIKSLLLSLWDSHEDKTLLAKEVMEGYIFGKYSTNEHYNIDEIMLVVDEINVEKLPSEESQIIE